MILPSSSFIHSFLRAPIRLFSTLYVSTIPSFCENVFSISLYPLLPYLPEIVYHGRSSPISARKGMVSTLFTSLFHKVTLPWLDSVLPSPCHADRSSFIPDRDSVSFLNQMAPQARHLFRLLLRSSVFLFLILPLRISPSPSIILKEVFTFPLPTFQTPPLSFCTELCPQPLVFVFASYECSGMLAVSSCKPPFFFFVQALRYFFFFNISTQ